MSEHVSVPLETLTAAFALLIEHLRQEAGTEVSLDKDYFWSIPRELLYDVYAQPTDLTVGQLSESLADLQSALADPSKVTTYGLVWLADLLKAIGLDIVR
ncbi:MULTISPECIES: hypothetical protein [Protofrankia]|uniref:Uncharacterized protein n=1 Tax=Candidatus Protofrankia datiscae TaxID=2716812 RepID=F8AZP9_9ACTN|nr:MULTISPECIES: hypothetical protein [Protofrankia]AEH09652.1 hypothetical protein FsymDg_2251 [Candidatus Protofrankia datiscae]